MEVGGEKGSDSAPPGTHALEGTPWPCRGCGKAVPGSELIPAAPLRAAQPQILSPTTAPYLIRDQGRPKSPWKIKLHESSQARGGLGNQSKWAFLLLLSAFPCLYFHLGQKGREGGGIWGWNDESGRSGVPRRDHRNADGDLSWGPGHHSLSCIPERS